MMFSYLQIYDPRERLLVGLADQALAVLGVNVRKNRVARVVPGDLRRILLLRLERIGDLLMTAGAIQAVHELAPRAEIDLVVGSWNRPIAELFTGITRVETLDASWLAREGQGLSLAQLARRALGWRNRCYDLAIDFQGDIRNNLLLALSGARVRVGYGMAGGGPLLTHQGVHDPTEHTATNALRLVGRAFGTTVAAQAFRLSLPADIQRRAERWTMGARRPIVGIHPSGGREIKQWDPVNLAELAGQLADEAGATIMLTGASVDEQTVQVRRALPASVSVIDLVGKLDILETAATLERLDLFITPDTGPMHLAAAVGTPIIAIFGPSDPRRYAPIGSRGEIVRIDLPCSPCNRIRLPPMRCRGHVPDCLRGIGVSRVYDAAVAQLSARQVGIV